MDSLNLPKFNIPDLKRKRITPEAYQHWIIQNIENLEKSGQLEKILKSPTRCPVDVRFVLQEGVRVPVKKFDTG